MIPKIYTGTCQNRGDLKNAFLFDVLWGTLQNTHTQLCIGLAIASFELGSRPPDHHVPCMEVGVLLIDGSNMQNLRMLVS